MLINRIFCLNRQYTFKHLQMNLKIYLKTTFIWTLILILSKNNTLISNNHNLSTCIGNQTSVTGQGNGMNNQSGTILLAVLTQSGTLLSTMGTQCGTLLSKMVTQSGTLLSTMVSQSGTLLSTVAETGTLQFLNTSQYGIL